MWTIKYDPVNLSMEQKQTTDIENRFVVAEGEEGKGRIGSLELAESKLVYVG